MRTSPVARREFLQRAAVAGVAAWTAPTIVSCFASPAAASTPTAPTVQPSYVTIGSPQSRNGASSQTPGLPASGAFYLLLVVVDNAQAVPPGVELLTPTGWTNIAKDVGVTPVSPATSPSGPKLSVWWGTSTSVTTAPTVKNTQGGMASAVISFDRGTSAAAGTGTYGTISSSTQSGSFSVSGLTASPNCRFVFLGSVEGSAGQAPGATAPFWSVTTGTQAVLVSPATFSVPDLFVAQFATTTGSNGTQTAAFSGIKANAGKGYTGLQIAINP